MSENSMEENVELESDVGGKKGIFSPKKLIIIVLGLAIIGALIAFLLIKNDDKTQYLLAEKQNLDNMIALSEERFGDEITWAELSKEKPVAQNMELALDVKDEWGAYIPAEVTDILKNSSFEINTVTDPKERQAQFALVLNVLGFTIDDMEAFVTPEKLIFTLPFLNDHIQLKDEDYGKVEEWLMGYSEQEKLGLENFMDPDVYEAFTYERMEKEYINYIFEEIPDEAFSSSKEKVKVFGEDVNAEKLVMELSDKQLKDLTIKLFTKLKDDEEIKSLLEDLMQVNGLNDPYLYGDIVAEYEDGLTEMINEIKNSTNKAGLTSTVWKNGKDIVKRDLSLTSNIGEDYEATVSLIGTQLIEKDSQKFDYTFGVGNEYSEESFNLVADLSNKKGKIKDEIELNYDNNTLLVYEAEEEVKKGNRTFERAVTFDDGYESTYRINWDGDTSYKKDSMEGTHEFYVDMEDEEVRLSLVADVDGKVVKGVELPEDVKDLGSMDENEFYAYFEQVFGEEFEVWLEDVLLELVEELGIDPYYLF